MKENIDQFFKEKFENLEIQPRSTSKDIFLKKAAQKKSKRMFRFAASASAAVILILASGYFMLKDIIYTSETSTITLQKNEKTSNENYKPEVGEKFDEVNPSKNISLMEVMSHSKGEYSLRKSDNHNKDNSLVLSQVSDLNLKDTTVEQSTENISSVEPEIEIKVTGFSEQIVHYAMAESNQKPIQISFQLLNQKFTVQSPVIEEVDQVYHQLKKGLKDFNLADASRTISNNLIDKISSRKNQNQNNY